MISQIVFYNNPTIFLFQEKNEPFRSVFFTPVRRFSWHIRQPSARLVRIRLHSSMYFPIFPAFRKTSTPGESNIRKVTGECTGICKGCRGYFRRTRHLISTTTVFIAMTTVFVAASCRVHYVWTLTSWRWRRSSSQFSAHLTGKVLQ